MNNDSDSYERAMDELKKTFSQLLKACSLNEDDFFTIQKDRSKVEEHTKRLGSPFIAAIAFDKAIRIVYGSYDSYLPF